MAEDTEQATAGGSSAAPSVDLFGSYRHKVDEKGRVSVPADFRQFFSGDLVVTRSPHDEALYVFDPDGFNAWIDQAFIDKFGKFDSSDPRHVRTRRTLKSRTAKTSLDKVGRITLPAAIREMAGIERDVVILGNTGYFEIWDAKRFDEMDQEADVSFLFG
ncbi:division/cell wall cluster transcriptional repressor MraZ [Xiamenia xianingshaonis]|uniref:Transcriptional regulator MraZ n=1 Tax=Xiamenia xianingshaonis TaxID=2682776 RepID=A0A9E6MQZ0_9ACTN|nr:division/cell wall cluster transcriptional repressor MraZ [Xiamenia xianingshaonis]NGM18087.1 division/cell wall cluster transcriptional repressor MraZ [Eggerthellaceae bacterium zg-893]NHM14843.1 division/cell wall cluster transcriptional repressor MraZ [Xiamenia xianingshaonis]NHM15475.1 division/cell wall cluster transcriptional repressor MraZ [Xiamenia xianingshaonis]QTU84752.1 division/cell wall cluster transcriptional repressor MraZ [Xiamenia xianingshaonis]